MSEEPPASGPPQRVLHDGFWKHGRFYGSWRRNKYFFPIDSEELNRMDIFHKFFLVARDDMPCSLVPTNDPIKIMDLGTGTAIWAMHVAEVHFPNSEVMAVDLNQIQPSLIPRNLTPTQFDIEDRSWEPLLHDCHLIHMRLLLGSIQTELWPQVYKNVFDHLIPGQGMIEHVEFDWTPYWDEDSAVPPASAFKEWTQFFFTAMDLYGRNARASVHDPKRLMEDAGFTEFNQKTVRCYVNPWLPDFKAREMGKWFNLAFCNSVDAMSLMPMIEKLGKTQAEVEELCHRVKREVCVLKYHAYVNLHVWTAKRPAVA